MKLSSIKLPGFEYQILNWAAKIFSHLETQVCIPFKVMKSFKWSFKNVHFNCIFKFPSSPQIPMQYQAMQSMKMLQGPSTAQYRGIKSIKMFQEPDVTDDVTNSAAAQWKLKTKCRFNILQVSNAEIQVINSGFCWHCRRTEFQISNPDPFLANQAQSLQ